LIKSLNIGPALCVRRRANGIRARFDTKCGKNVNKVLLFQTRGKSRMAVLEQKKTKKELTTILQNASFLARAVTTPEDAGCPTSALSNTTNKVLSKEETESTD
jgi:hypothetical protein